MKTAMKLTTGFLAITMTVGAAFSAKAVAQNTDAIDNARSIAKSLQQKQANDSNAALDAAGVPNPGKPAAGAPAPAVRPAVIPAPQPSSSSAAAPVVKPAAKPAAKAEAKPAAPKSASTSSHNQLQRVNVVPGGDKIQIELSSSASVTPQISKLSSPARVLVEMPDTVMAGAQSKIAVGAGGVKGVRIGMDGKTPPTTSVVIDLEKALAYEVAPGANGKFVLTLHTEGATPVANSTPAAAKTPAKAVVAKADAGKAAPKAAKPVVAKSAPAKPAVAKTAVVAANKPAPKGDAFTPKVDAGKTDANQAGDQKAEDKKPEEKKQEDKKWAMNGKRDPFFSPVVQQAGSGCSTGKKCLDIGAINLRGVVKSDTGFIAVVTNNLNKAYFLRENDPVFNGYVMKITGDSVTFQETVQDKLGKSFTREVVKRIFTPAV